MVSPSHCCCCCCCWGSTCCSFKVENDQRTCSGCCRGGVCVCVCVCVCAWVNERYPFRKQTPNPRLLGEISPWEAVLMFVPLSHTRVEVWSDPLSRCKSSLVSDCPPVFQVLTLWTETRAGWSHAAAAGAPFSARQKVGEPLRKREVRSRTSPAGRLMQSREEWRSKYKPRLSRKNSRARAWIVLTFFFFLNFFVKTFFVYSLGLWFICFNIQMISSTSCPQLSDQH